MNCSAICIQASTASGSILSTVSKNADYVISMLPNAKNYMISHGLSPEKFNYIPNGVEKEKRKDKSQIPKLLRAELDKIKGKDNKIIGYAGYHNTQNALMCLVRAAEIAREEKIHFNLSCFVVCVFVGGIISDSINRGKGLIVVVNKWDLIKKDTYTMKEFQEDMIYELPTLKNYPIIFISIKNNLRVRQVLEKSLKIYEARCKKIKTSLFMTFLLILCVNILHLQLKEKKLV